MLDEEMTEDEITEILGAVKMPLTINYSMPNGDFCSGLYNKAVNKAIYDALTAKAKLVRRG